MGRFRDTGQDSEETVIDMSPLIDCVFILLIFFIVTTTFVEEVGIEVDKPESAPPMQSQQENTTIIIALSTTGEVRHEGKVIGMSGIQPLVKLLRQREDAPVIIQAEKDAEAGLLIQIMDQARLAGASVVSIASR